MAAMNVIALSINMVSRKEIGSNEIGLSLCLNKDMMAYPGRKRSNNPANALSQLIIPRESKLTKTFSFMPGNNRTASKQNT